MKLLGTFHSDHSLLPSTVMQILHILERQPYLTKCVYIQIYFSYTKVLSWQECIALQEGDVFKPLSPESVGLKNKQKVKYGFIYY